MKRRRGFVGALVLSSLLGLPLAGSASADAGELDRSFGRDGLRTLDFGAFEVAHDLAILPGGKILVAGTRTRFCGSTCNTDAVLARLHPNGDLDRTFGNDGWVRTHTGTGSVAAIAVQENGRILVANERGPNLRLFRFRRGGTVDRHFGENGVVTTRLAGEQRARDLAIQDDGSIVVAGINLPQPGFLLARYLPDGRLDPSFSGDGTLITDFPEGSEVASALGLSPGGGIVAAGDVDGREFAVAQYDLQGNLDPSFSEDGLQTTDFTREWDSANRIGFDGNRTVVAGANCGRCDFALARYRSDGTLDPTFSRDGRQTTRFPRGSADLADVVVAPGGKLVAVGGVFRWGGGWKFALARYRRDGRLDPTFSDDGRRETGFGRIRGEFDSSARAVALDAAGRIVVAGILRRDLAIVRYRG
jgi:uncharacterized delta-60 repeat protein